MQALIADHGATRVVAPPAVCARLASAEGEPLAVSAIFTGGGPVFPNLLRAIQAAAPRAAVWSVYGSTEAEPIAHVEAREIGDADWRAMAEGEGLLAGAPIPEIAVELRDHEIFVAGPHVNAGYLDPADDASTKFPRDGVVWHRTGDAGRLDAAGRLWLWGRRGEAAGGLFPFRVETAALSWPGVEQAGLVARPNAPALLALAGRRLDEADAARRAKAIGDIEVRRLKSLPTDRRHNSKIDYPRLRRALGVA
jgi:acyl-CoA synthetase (AMP-forming)/AMP-acid ligase II